MKRVLYITCFFLLTSLLFPVEFDNLNGSDLMLGVGARQIALGGAGSLIESSPATIFWNPAGLADFENSELQIDFETPIQVNDLVFVFSHPKLHFAKIPFNLGFSIINRLRFKGEGDEVWSGYSAHLLDLTMINMNNFRGKIDSKTYDYRLSITAKPSEKIRAGLTLVRLD
ncbi:MAG TPA: hypothetical protein PLD62_09160 [Candidatus Cloacimonadota bacterium]|nr:hypothetical protein [Candidatus Cloacimonadota bacterium]